uniref:Uncharacterized protein n=1 Tax=Ascaris lumbricoides TaxID=6252 RepID=A0A0M3ITK2_ASCLU
MSDEELFVGDAGGDNPFAERSDRRDADSASGSGVLQNGAECGVHSNEGGAEPSSSSSTSTTATSSGSANGGSSGSSSHSGPLSGAPKRLFSPSNATCANFANRASIDSAACGSEFARSPEDAVYASNRFDSKTEGSIKLNISNLGALRQKVTTSFHTIANLPWYVFSFYLSLLIIANFVKHEPF